MGEAAFLTKQANGCLSDAMDTPWRIGPEIRRRLLAPLVQLRFAANGVRWGRGWLVYGMPVLRRHRGSQIRIGDELVLRSWFASNPLGVQRAVLSTWAAGAELVLGNEVKATGVTLCAQCRITIGNRVRLGAGVMVIDTDFHPLAAGDRIADPRAGRAVEVAIGDDVFIGTRSIVLKWTTIGAGAVVGAGSAGDVPAGALFAGNPARMVREL